MTEEPEIKEFFKSMSIIILIIFSLFMIAYIVHHYALVEKPLINQSVVNTSNQNIDQITENKSTVIISMPIPKSITEAAENITLLNWSAEKCSDQDYGPMVELRFGNNINETQNISLYVNGINVSAYRYNRLITLAPYKLMAVNTFLNQSLLKRNGNDINFSLQIKDGEDVIDERSIACTLSGGGGSSVSSVTQAPAPVQELTLTRIEVTPSNAEVNKGSTKTFTAEGFDQFGNLMEVIFKWTSGNRTIGTVDSNGEFEAKSAGIVAVTASNGSISGNATVTVSEVPISTPIPTPTSTPTQTPVITPTSNPTVKPTETSTPAPTPTAVPTLTSTPVPISILTTIIITPTVAYMFEGGTMQFTAAAYDQFNKIMNVVINWTSSNHTVGSVNETGVFIAKEGGKSIITASNGSVKKNATVTVQEEIKSTPTPTLTPVTTPTPIACNILYAVHDEGVGDSQFIVINLANESATALGPKYKNYNFEGLGIYKNILYASTGDEGSHGGRIYKVNITTGAITSVGDTGFKGVEALAFRSDGSLWGWSEGKGLISINTSIGIAELVFSSKIKIEGLAWLGNKLYASAENKLYVYDPDKKILTKIADNLPGNTEALEIWLNGMLLGGWHNSDSESIFVYDPNKLKLVAKGGITIPYNDIEGIAWPSNCLIK